MNDERGEHVVELLGGLREAMSELETPARVEAPVLAAFRRRHRSQFRQWPRVGAAAAAAAVIVIGAWRLSLPEGAPAVVRVGVEPQQETEVRVAAERPAPVVQTTSLRRTPSRMETRVPPASRLRKEELATDFLPLPYAPPLDPGEGGQVIRVKLPRLAMRDVGLPVSEDRWNERVPADVVLGQDGVARAVRFVKVAQQ